MRYRKLDINGDYTFGHGGADFLVNSAATVGQAIQTALLLVQNEWFLDNTAGVPYYTQIFGYDTQSLYDSVLKAAILNVQGVTDILNYTSTLNTVTRQLVVNVTVQTQFSQPITVTAQLQTPSFGYGVNYGVGGYGQ